MFINVDIELSKLEEDRLIAYIQKEVLRQILERIQNNAASIINNLHNRIIESWVSSLGAHELTFGKLRFDLGLKEDEARQAVHNIAAIIANQIGFTAIKSHIDRVTVTIGFIKSDYAEVLQIPEASFIQEYPTSHPSHIKIDWLEWLLRKGDQYEIKDYHVIYGNFSQDSSRSQHGLMIKGGIWRIPPDWSSDHFLGNIIVRAFQGIDKYIKGELIKVI
jgi:hypothetical protein